LNTIAFISKNHVSNNIGGAEVQTDILATSMAEAGWEVIYVTTSVSEVARSNKYKLIHAPATKKGFKRVLSEINADIYYQRGRKELTEWVGEFCKETGKFFVFATSMDIDCFRHKFLYRHNGSVIEKFKQAIVAGINRNLDNKSLWGMQQATLILAQTNYQKDSLRANLGLESHVFYNVHDLTDCKEKANNDYPVVLWLANLKEWKQPEVFLRLVADMKESKCKFVMAGGIKSQKYKRLIDFTLNTNGNFEFLGPVSFEKSNELFTRADVFVNTSIAQEGFPNTFIQSWLQGVPTISLLFDPDNLINKEQLGIVANGNYTRLKEAILVLLQDTSLRKQYGKNARKFAASTFSRKAGISRFIELLNGK
jgi:glycosyltransferase involved in cell wall biosynthesis